MEGDRLLADVPGFVRAWSCCRGIPPAASATSSADRGLLFHRGCPSAYDGITGHHGPPSSSRAFTHDSRAALASLTTLDTISADLLLARPRRALRGTPADATQATQRKACADTRTRHRQTKGTGRSPKEGEAATRRSQLPRDPDRATFARASPRLAH